MQYPGIDTAIESDLGNANLLFGGLGMLFPGLEPGPVVEELRERLLEELDYRIEADNQRLFIDAYRGHPFIHVPEVVDELSTRRVLTTELAEGVRFDEVLTWSQDATGPGGRDDLPVRVPEPLPPARLQRRPPPRQLPVPTRRTRRLPRLRAGEAVHRRRGRRLLVDDPVARPRRRRRVVPADDRGHRPAPGRRAVLATRLVEEYFGHFYEWVIADEPSTMTPEYASESVRRFFDASGPYGPIMKAANVPPSFVIIQRINLGLYALLGDLRATANWRRVAEELWDFVDGPPSTPMGEAEHAWLATRRTSDLPS